MSGLGAGRLAQMVIQNLLTLNCNIITKNYEYGPSQIRVKTGDMEQ